jgi:hypothetical protein
MKKFRKIAAVITFLFCMVISIAATHKDPPVFKNLKVLPKNISDEDLDLVMDKFKYALNVKCNYCHVRNDSTKKFDFASDAKPEKDMARDMMRMTYSINKKYFNFAKSKTVPETVTCITCHRKNPIPLTDSLYTNMQPHKKK